MHRSLTIALASILVACPGEEDDDGSSHPTPDTFTAIADGYDPGALLSMWSSGPDDIWAAGGESGRAVVLRFDGTGWTRDDPPLAEQLWWVHGFPGGPVFVVGDGGAIARWSNGSWEAMESGFPDTTFFGVWGATPDDVWAVGGRTVTSSVGDVVLHYDGASWERISVPFLETKPDSAQKSLFKVWGASADDVVIVGSGGETLHFDGTTFQKKESGVPGITLFTVWGRAENDIYAVGGEGAPELIHYDGSAWSRIELPIDVPQVLQGLWTAPGQPVFISGYDGYVACRGDDGAWTTFEPAVSNALHAVMGDGAGGVWAAGGNIESFRDDYRGALVVSGRDVPAITE